VREHLRGHFRPLEVRGDDRRGRQRRQQRSGPGRLRDTCLVQLDVDLALEATFEIPAGLAVPPDDEATALPGQDAAPAAPGES
jgi:hypothetical protein